MLRAPLTCRHAPRARDHSASAPVRLLHGPTHRADAARPAFWPRPEHRSETPIAGPRAHEVAADAVPSGLHAAPPTTDESDARRGHQHSRVVRLARAREPRSGHPPNEPVPRGREM